MIEIGTKTLEVVWLLFRLIRPGGAQGLLAEVVILRQQLLVLKREKPRRNSPRAGGRFYC
jgi:hypothetical protein